jgi:hypothetical protein
MRLAPTHTQMLLQSRNLGMSYDLVMVWSHAHFYVFRRNSKVKCQEHCAFKPVPNKLVQTVTLLICIREVP